jgi:hypothetical protein
VEVTVVKENGVGVAVVSSDTVLITDVRSALDLMATVAYETGCDRIILPKTAVYEDFFDLKSRLAGEVLQKFVTYQVKVAIVGDFSGYPSKSLKDFIYESNRGNDIFFVSDEEQAIDKLSRR